jgi:hypothetical protein
LTENREMRRETDLDPHFGQAAGGEFEDRISASNSDEHSRQ